MDDFATQLQCEDLFDQDLKEWYEDWTGIVKAEFSSPTQVLFYDSNDEGYHTGIAYNKEVICLGCGAVFEVKEIIVTACTNGKIPFFENSDEWRSLEF